jgi:two-component system response regulator VicR
MGRVLLLEDEPSIAGIIRFKLGREGHEVRWELSAVAAEAAAGAFGPDLVVLDAAIEGDALAVLDRLRRRCPVLVLTDLGDAETPALALGRGAATTVRKPFKPTVLARTVAQLLRERAGGS